MSGRAAGTTSPGDPTYRPDSCRAGYGRT
jgi:hypothetical protein